MQQWPQNCTEVPYLFHESCEISHERYDLCWVDGVKYGFTTRRAWNSLRETSEKVYWKYLVWHYPTVLKCSFTGWVTIQGKLPTMDRVKKWGIQWPNRCVQCLHHLESIDHLFFNCEFSFAIYRQYMGEYHGWANFNTFLHEWQVSYGVRRTRDARGRLSIW